MSQAGIVSDTSGGGNDIRTITGNSGGPVAGDASFNVDLLGGAGVNVVGSPGTNTLTISLTGGSAAIDSIAVNAATAPGTNPVLPDALGLVNVLGASTAAGTTPVQTNSLAVNTYTVQVQTSQAVAATDATKIGLANFNSAHFSCDANGFVSLSGGGQAIDSLLPNSGTTPVVPAADGSITLQGTGSITTVGGLNSLTPQLTGLTNHNVLVGAGTATITNVAPSATAGIPLVSNGAAADPSFTTAVVQGGGTGATTLTAHGVLLGQGTSPVTATAVGATGTVLSGNTGADPTFQTLATLGGITSITGNSGGAEVPSAGNFNILGTGSITVAGSANTETVQLTGLTNHAVLVGAGTATITNVGPSATTGAVLASNGAAADPSFQTLSSLGATLTLAGNTGTATPSSGTITITTGASNAEGTSVFTGSGSTLTHTFSDASSNVGLGKTALDSLSGGTQNTALGTNALTAVVATSDSTGIGYNALSGSNSNQCTAVGSGAGSTNSQVGLTAVGYQAANSTSGGSVTAIGFQALKSCSANNNTAIGAAVMSVNTVSGTNNTAIGQGSSLNLSSGANTTSVGQGALAAITTGSNATAIGSSALAAATSSDCVGVGYQAGKAITSGIRHTAIGTQSLVTVSTGTDDTAIGYQALNLCTGTANTACGSNAGKAVSTGNSNSLFGESAGVAINSGAFNSVVGGGSLANLTTGQFNTCLGYATGNSLTGAEGGNICIGTGSSVGTGFSNSLVMGVNETGTASNQIDIFAKGTQIATTCFIGGIRGVTTGVNDAVAVLIDSARQLGTTSSSARFKENIVDITNSDKLQQLRPVQFNYPQFSSDRPEYGLIAEEVESIFPEMIVYDKAGLPETVQYHKLYGLMLAEIQRLHKRIEVLEVK